MIDQTAKILLLAIALGLWANLLSPLLAAHAAQAPSTDNLLLVAQGLGVLDGDLGLIEKAMESLADGSCSNRNLC